MPRQRKLCTYRPATRKEQSKIYFTGYELGELFDDEQIGDFMAVARRRIIGEFYYAIEKNPRYKPDSNLRPYQRTDNYIWGLREKLSELAKYVRTHMRRGFIAPDQLPSYITDLRPKEIDMVIQRAQHDVLLLTLQDMRNREIWYDEGLGIWQICQSSVDEFLEYKRTAKTARTKADMRPFHGRVRSQSKNRMIPAGTSVGLA